MNADRFQVVFNVVDGSYKLWFFPALAGLLLAFFCFLAVLVKVGILPKVNWKVACLLAFGLVLSLVNCFVTTRNYLVFSDALVSGKTSYVEGTVTDLVTLPKRESFSVNGVHFSYDDDLITGGFNNMSSHGGPIRAGLYVRIWYVGNVILKIEEKQ